ncbi:hypothetical protein D3C85_1536580 [compost metagenome]
MVDKQLNLYGELETEFAKEFSKQWQDYQERQMRAIAGTATPNTVNTFNEIT